MKINFTRASREDLQEIIDWYDEIDVQIANRFLVELKELSNRIVGYPTSFELIDSNIRRCLFIKFPYMILFTIEKNEVIILSIVHQYRHPKNRFR